MILQTVVMPSKSIQLGLLFSYTHIFLQSSLQNITSTNNITCLTYTITNPLSTPQPTCSPRPTPTITSCTSPYVYFGSNPQSDGYNDNAFNVLNMTISHGTTVAYATTTDGQNFYFTSAGNIAHGTTYTLKICLSVADLLTAIYLCNPNYFVNLYENPQGIIMTFGCTNLDYSCIIQNCSSYVGGCLCSASTAVTQVDHCTVTPYQVCPDNGAACVIPVAGYC